MRNNLKHIWQRLLKLLRLSPLSLAEKCRIAFGAAVVFILALALLLPYIWMSQLTKKILLDSDKAKAETLLFRQHFQVKDSGETALPVLDKSGSVLDVNDSEILWIRFTKEEEKQLQQLAEEQKEMIDSLKSEKDRKDGIQLRRKGGVLQSTYVRIFRATDSCINCHNPQGSASAFSRNEPIGVVTG